MPESQQDELVRTLLSKRADWEVDRKFFVFLLDSYTGGGGYEGSIQASTTAWEDQLCAGSSDILEMNRRSYLDRHVREQDKKFTRRREMACYSNFVATIQDLLVGFMLARDFERREIPTALKKWIDDVDGNGTKLDDARANMSLRSMIFGWSPSCVDMPSIDPALAPVNKAQADAMGFTPRLVLLFGTHLVDWQHMNGRKGFEWAKTHVTRIERPTMFEKPKMITRVTYWTRTTVEWWDIFENQIEKDSGGPQKHTFGGVPVSICRVKTALDGEVKGTSPGKQISFANRRLFNVENELDEHIRSQVFALLAIPVTRDPDTNKIEKPPDDMTLGTENGIFYPADSQGDPFFLAPPAAIAATLETRVAGITREIYRQAGVEYVKPQADDQSGVARKYAFANTDRKLRDMAKEVARWETEVLRLAARQLSVPEDEIEKIHVEPPTSFDVEELTELMSNALDVLSIQVGETATAKLRMKVAKAILGKLSPEDEETIEEEIRALGAQDSADRAAGAAGRGAGANGAFGKPKPGAVPKPGEPDPADDPAKQAAE